MFFPWSPVMSGVPESAGASANWSSADSLLSGTHLPSSLPLSLTRPEVEPPSTGARGKVTQSLRGERDEDTPVPQIPL